MGGFAGLHSPGCSEGGGGGGSALRLSTPCALTGESRACVDEATVLVAVHNSHCIQLDMQVLSVGEVFNSLQVPGIV